MAGSDRAPPEVLETGVPNLDRILGGGLLGRSLVMVIGTPGTGKTLLAQQIAFHVAGLGATALYLTGYSETHDKLLSFSRGLTFVEPEVIGRRLQFGSLPDLLHEGPDQAADAIVATARTERRISCTRSGRSSRCWVPPPWWSS